MSINMQKNSDLLNRIEDELIRLTSEPALNSKQTVAEAMRYSLLSGGKRVRPILTISTAESLGADISEELIKLASALEIIHTYSLIHDDLPSMDDDNLRRGKPTNHIMYGEGMAVLAGDGLLNLAYEELFDICLKRSDLLKACSIIAKEAGVNGMIGGQSMDLSNFKAKDREDALNYLIELQKLKTGGLIKAAILSGYHYAKAMLNTDKFTSELEGLYTTYADKLGLAFQIRDDLLDVVSTEETLGKTVGKDARDDKLTFVTLLGVKESKEYEEKLHDEIISIVKEMKRRGISVDFISYFTSILMHRDY